MLEKFRHWLKVLNDLKHPAGIFESSLIIGTFLCLLFGLYQTVFAGDLFFGLLSAVCVVVGTAGLFKWIGNGSVIYVSAYGIPSLFYLLAIGYRVFWWSGVDPAPYYLNGWISSVSALLPLAAAILSSVLIPPVSCFLRWLELRLS